MSRTKLFKWNDTGFVGKASPADIAKGDTIRKARGLPSPPRDPEQGRETHAQPGATEGCIDYPLRELGQVSAPAWVRIVFDVKERPLAPSR